MKSTFTLFPAFLLAMLVIPFMGFTQNEIAPVPEVATPVYFDISPPLRDIPVITPVPQKKEGDEKEQEPFRIFPRFSCFIA